MNSKFTIVFTENNARILKPGQPFNINLPHKENTTIDHLKGIPPHFWILDGDVIRGMTESERSTRAAHHETHEVNNNILPLSEAVAKSKFGYYFIRIAIVVAIIASTYFLIRRF